MANKNFLIVLLGFFVLAGVTIAIFLDINKKQNLVRVEVPRGADALQPSPSPAQSPLASASSSPGQIGMTNPASTNCIKNGGTLLIQKRNDGSEYGLCTFEDAYACEEWALFSGECPVGGVRTTGYDTVPQKYCAWVGGQTYAEPNAICTFKDGSTCKDTDLFSGACRKGDNPS